MSLASPSQTEQYSSLDDLMHAVNTHAKAQGYAVTKRRTRSGKNGINQAVLCCDRGRQYQSRIPLEFKQRSTGTRQTGCPFAAKAKSNGVFWTLIVQNAAHNHDASIHPSAHSVHQTLSPAVRQDIAQQSAAGSVPRQIESALRLANPELIITREDIRNARKAIRHKNLGQDTPVQALFQQLQPPNWTHHAIVDSQSRVRSLFFYHARSFELFCQHPEVILLDCTYKTNRFQLPLLSMVGLNAMGKSFFIAFAFLQDETEERYAWAMEQLRSLFQNLGNRYKTGPEVFVSDRDLALLAAIRSQFPQIPHLLCLWHINKCVVAKCKPLFEDQEHWDAFYQDWQKVGQQDTPSEFAVTWTQFRAKWLPCERGESTFYPEADAENPAPSTDGVDYLETTWIIYKRRWAKAWTNQVRHFGNKTTSVVEGSHAVLKKYLQVSTGDLKKVVDNLELMLAAQQSSYIANLSAASLRIPFDIKIPPFNIIRRYVTPQALRKVLVHYNDLSKITPFPTCTGVFTHTLGLPCGHKLREAIDTEQPLNLWSVHSHWYFQPLEQPSERLAYSHELFIQDPPIIQSRGRPQKITATASSREAARRIQRQVASQIQQEAESSTRRYPSEFEIVERILTVHHNQT